MSAREDGDPGAGPTPARGIAGRVLTVLAGLLVLAALVAPNQLGLYSFVAFLRLPLEGLFGLGLVLVLPPRWRRVLAVPAGIALGLVLLVKLLDIGFYESLARPFDLVLDWGLLDDAFGVLEDSAGRGGAIAAVVGIVVLLAGVMALLALSVRRLVTVAARHDALAFRVLAGLAVVWVATAAFGVPPADYTASALVADRARQVRLGLADRGAFAQEAGVDAFRDKPAAELLTALRGKDVMFAFIESYGRSAVEDEIYAPAVGAVLDRGTTRLAAAGFSARSGWLTSPTAGGGSWLAHATMLSGLWISNDQRHRALLASDRMTLNTAFKKTGCRTVGFMPAIDRAWPEGDFFGYDKLYDSRNMGYRGPKFAYAPMPDQYTLAHLQRTERAVPGRGPLFSEVALVSSHVPWAPLPAPVPWDSVGDGSVFGSQARDGKQADDVWKDRAAVRTEYRRSIEYTLEILVSYLETYGDDNLVLVFLGDHQPAPLITGDNASRDVPVTIVAKDRALLERTAGWGWNEGLKPLPQAPVWPMSDFRDRFLTAFGPGH